MKARNKKALAYGGAAIIVIIVIWLLLKRGGTTIYNEGAPANFGDVIVPGFDYQGRSGQPIVIPSMGADPYKLTMIGACCADCSRPKATAFEFPPPVNLTFVSNTNKGSTIYYHAPPPPPPKPRGSAGAWFST